MFWHFHLLNNFPQFVVIHIVKRFDEVNEADAEIFLGWVISYASEWDRILTECGPLEKGMANHFSILALRTP